MYDNLTLVLRIASQHKARCIPDKVLLERSTYSSMTEYEISSLALICYHVNFPNYKPFYNFEATRREGSAENSALPSRRVTSKFRARARVCIPPAPQSPSPKLETTRSLPKQQIMDLLRNTWIQGVLFLRP